MDLLAQRSGGNKDSILQEKFIQKILSEEADEMDSEMIKLMMSRGFTDSALLTGRSFNVNNGVLAYNHLQRHRFIDMNTRNTKSGKIKKVAHPIHNRILFGFANNIVRRLSFEFTDKTKQLLMGNQNN